MEKLKVFITRHPSDYCGDEISIDQISGVKWDCISGGVNRKQSGYSLYGYIDYSLAKDLVNCSGRHDFGYNSAKICISATSNNCPKYIEGYKILCEQAGPKPPSQISLSRPKGYPPCTKRILQILDQTTTITRKELRGIIINDGYEPVTFRNAMKRLERKSRIILQGSSCSGNQLVSKNPSSDREDSTIPFQQSK